ncbi:hypothetical protein AWB78_05334 [Caballeronia calidae]|uniref:Uncharacterized protein n=1 Tax=Caballeronia calidae TaxID=1777139 RepID=A0A158DLS0_9BURK|nr:hypothetical protein [Caballeronia calidae]SAK95380.1 hypothetical protein AWB78_05334 [Caballeronia calidae]
MLNKIFGSGLPEVPEPEPQKLFDKEQTTTTVITTSRGTVEVIIRTFSALTGWELRSYAKEFYSPDRDKFNAFTNAVLSHASIGGVALDSAAIQNEQLEKWQNVQAVFDAVLEHNGIEMNVAFALSNEIHVLGIQMGRTFVTSVDRILDPLRKMAEQEGAETK